MTRPRMFRPLLLMMFDSDDWMRRLFERSLRRMELSRSLCVLLTLYFWRG